MERLCPRCSVALVPEAGAGERCPTCGGHHLDVELAGPLLEREVGRPIDELKQIAGMFGGQRLDCPGCGGQQSPVTLRGVPIDLCLQCGAVWLDSGELSALTGGRVAETPPPLGDVTVRSRVPESGQLASSSTKGERPKRLPAGLSHSQLGGLFGLFFAGPFMTFMMWGSDRAIAPYPFLFMGVYGVIATFLTKRIEIDDDKQLVCERLRFLGFPLKERTVPFARVQSAYVQTHVRRTKNGTYDAYRLNVAAEGLTPPLSSWDVRKEHVADDAAAHVAAAVGLPGSSHRVELESRGARRLLRR